LWLRSPERHAVPKEFFAGARNFFLNSICINKIFILYLRTLMGDHLVSREFRIIVRLYGTSLDGTKPLPYALCGIKGMGIRVSRGVVKGLGLDPTMRLGDLSDSEIKRLEDVLENPAARGLPSWLLNRRKDPQTGGDLHLLTSDLTLRVKGDIDLMREIRSWKGERHGRGLKVRGQRTKTTSRKGRSVGVSRSRQRQR
jgi:small subunit ribosomal protein S13